jgi:hypothetical protein
MLIKLNASKGVCKFEDKSISEESFEFADFFSFLRILQDAISSKLLDSIILRHEIKFVAVRLESADDYLPEVSCTGLAPYNWTLPTSVVLRLMCLQDFDSA